MAEPSNVSTAAITPHVGHQKYLVTYSQDKSLRFPLEKISGSQCSHQLC